MTELAGASHLNHPDRLRLGTVGAPLSVLEHKIADDGEILVRGPNVFLGYLHNEEATRAMIDADGWLHIGDVGEIATRAS
jgi:long-chain acyl-CoA synthetase